MRIHDPDEPPPGAEADARNRAPAVASTRTSAPTRAGAPVSAYSAGAAAESARAATASRRTLVALLALAAAWFALIAATIMSGRPQAIADAPPGAIECVSYAPFRQPGETPFDATARVSRERIAHDLRLLSQQTRCVRTYSVAQGLDAVPEVAASMGMKVLLGAWLSRERAQNRVELDRAIALAREHRDTVGALIVGNEVLLRRELPENELSAALQRARSEAGVPVTYADVWEFWLQHPGLAASVDFVTIHILPYWEDEPVAIDDAVEHVRGIYRQVEQSLGRSPGGAPAMLLGETGWPSAGRSRRGAQPGPVEQARFMREFVAMARAEGIRYNLIEAFDQPWKARLEGAMGAHWGVLDSHGQAKFPWQGPVVEDPQWRVGLAWGAIGALAFAVFGFGAAALRARKAGTATGCAAVERRPDTFDSMPGATRARLLVGQALAGGIAAMLVFAQWRYVQDWNRDVLEWTATLPFVFATAPLAWLAIDDALAADVRRRVGAARRWLDRLRALFLFGAAVNIVLLVFDARYRGFPTVFFAIPAAVELLRIWLGRTEPPASDETRLMAAVVAIGSLLAVLHEGPSNLEALGYCALMFGYALARIDGRLLRTSASPASSTATADGS